MDRRQFIQAGGALAMACAPLSRALGQTTWTPPYPLPAAGQVVSLAGGNTLDEVATAANGWGNYGSTFDRAAPIYNGYGFGAFAPDYSTAGAMVIAGIGGHHAGGIWGGFLFDFTTGRWISKANANGKAETPGDPSVDAVDWSTGELRDKSGLSGQLPVPGHGYLWHFCPPRAVGGGSRGYLIKCCVAAGSDAGWDAARSFKFDLDTGAWSYASDNNVDFDGHYLNPYTDGGGDWDPLTNRFYSPQKTAYNDELRYLERTPAGWTWKKTWCPNLRNATLMTAFVNNRDFVLGYMDGAWQRVDLDNPGAGASTINMVNAGLLSGYVYTRFHRYPADGCWYTLRGKANRSAIDSWPNGGSPASTLAADQFLLKIDPATWTLSREAVDGGIVALWESVWADTPPHGNAFVYVPALQCFAWFPRPDGPVQLIRPKGGTAPTVDAQPPTVPAGLRVSETTSSSVTWAWNASTDNGGGVVAGYHVTVYDAADVPLAVVDVGNALSYTRSGLAAATTVKLRVSAYDNASPRNESEPCAAVAATTAGLPAGDTQPPTVPGTLRVTATTASSITWSWYASTDNGGGTVKGYRVVLYDANDAAIAGPLDVGNVLAYSATGLAANTAYALRVAAYDDAANASALSAPVQGKTRKKDVPGKGR